MALWRIALLLAAAACGLRFLWIGDVPFICDEPQLMANAMHANAKGRWAERGLLGTRGLHYGPLPTWIYQVGVVYLATPIQLALLKTLVITLVTITCLFIWARAVRESGWLVWFALLSPLLFFYARDLWDNSWCVPLSLLAWVGYLNFADRPALIRLLAPMLAAASLLLVHLMCLPLLAAMAVHGAWRFRGWLLSRSRGVAALSLLTFAIVAPYFGQVLYAYPPGLKTPPSVHGVLFVLYAPAYFSALDISYFLGGGWTALPYFPAWMKVVLAACVGLSLLSFLFFATGAVVAAATRRHCNSDSPGNVWLRSGDELAALTLLFFLVLSAWQGLTGHPHYFNAIWPAVFFFIWRGLAFCWSARPRTGRPLIIAWAAALSIALVMMVLRVHLGHGARSLHHGPTLSNLWQISRTIRTAPGQRISSRAAHPRAFPQCIACLVSWPAPEIEQETVPKGSWIIDYRHPGANWSGELIVRQQAAP